MITFATVTTGAQVVERDAAYDLPDLICAVPNMTVGIIILSGEYTFLFLVL
jgi:hypothetical protein